MISVPRQSFAALAIACGVWSGAGTLSCNARAEGAAVGSSPPNGFVRVGAVQTKSRAIDYRRTSAEVLDEIDKSLAEFEQIIRKAGEAGCDALAFPEDTPGLLHWIGMNEAHVSDVLPEAVKRMLDRLGRATARHHMYLVVCSDALEPDGAVYNTAFLLGRDGREIGRYHKVCPTWAESGARKRGTSFPVFTTSDLGTVGMLICYDMVVPETARCLALGGADIIFFPTMGGGAIGDDDIGFQALRVRAVENFVYVVVAQRGNGAMIISPQGKVLARAQGPDGLAIADIDPFKGREGGDATNHQADMRARLFRERNPAASGILADPHPPVLEKVPINISAGEAARISAKVLTIGEDEFKQATALAGAGKTQEAIAAFEKLRADYRDSWIDRTSEQRLAKLMQGPAPVAAAAAAPLPGIAAKYPGDLGIERDPHVLFAENFESSDTKKWDQKRGRVLLVEDKPNTGHWCVQMPMERGKNTGGDLLKWFMPGADTVYARFYVKFSPDYQYCHHFVWLGANQRTNKWSSFGKAGNKPDGTYYSTGMEPWFAWGKNPSPGEVNLYTYFLDMEPDRKMNKYWGTSFFPPGPGKGEAAGAGCVIPRLDQWQCWEFMIHANSGPDKPDGTQAMWMDGNLIGKFTGIRWRTDPDLKVNSFWLEHYGSDEGDPTKQFWKASQSVWFDDIVVATDYIGPLQR